MRQRGTVARALRRSGAKPARARHRERSSWRGGRGGGGHAAPGAALASRQARQLRALRARGFAARVCARGARLQLSGLGIPEGLDGGAVVHKWQAVLVRLGGSGAAGGRDARQDPERALSPQKAAKSARQAENAARVAPRRCRRRARRKTSARPAPGRHAHVPPATPQQRLLRQWSPAPAGCGPSPRAQPRSDGAARQQARTAARRGARRHAVQARLWPTRAARSCASWRRCSQHTLLERGVSLRDGGRDPPARRAGTSCRSGRLPSPALRASLAPLLPSASLASRSR